MFSKLLKHEFKAQRGILGVLSLAALGAGLLGGLMMWLFIHLAQSEASSEPMTTEYAVFMALLANFATMLMIGVVFAIVAYIIAVWILLLHRFYKHHFSDEGYLTFTLPVTTHQILLSSILNIAIWMIISIFVVIIALLAFLAPLPRITDDNIVESLFRNWHVLLEQFDISYYLLQTLSVIASAIYSLILPLLSIALGALAAKKHKILAAFGIYYGITTILSMINGVLQVFSLLGDYAISTDSESLYLVFSLLIPSLLHLGIGIGGYFLMHALVDKKLNLP